MRLLVEEAAFVVLELEFEHDGDEIAVAVEGVGLGVGYRISPLSHQPASVLEFFQQVFLLEWI